MRAIVSILVLSLVVLASGPAHAQKKKKKPPPPSIDLKGKSLKQVFAELLPGMGAADLAARNAPQQAWQKICFEASAPGNEKLRLEACELMAARLGADVPNPARVWLLLQLQRIGGEECIEQVAVAAKDKDTLVRDEAVRCLANIPSAKATGKLVSLLSGTEASARVGVLNALGHRKDRDAISDIARELADKDRAIVQAAARALGRMPGTDSAKALAAARKEAAKETLLAINDAYLSCADQLLRDGKQKEAHTIYQALNKASEPRGTRMAALHGVLKSSGDEAGALILDIMRGEDASARQVAIAHIENLSAGALKTVGQHLDKLPIPSQVMVLTAMAARGDRALLPIAASASASKVDAVARAGIQALGKLGDASVVPILLNAAAGKSPHTTAALNSLAQIPGEEVNQQLIATLEKEKSVTSAVQIIEVLGRRKALSATPVLLKHAESAEASIRMAAFTSLGTVAEPKDARGMINAFLKLDKKARELASSALVTICSRETEPEKRADPIFTYVVKTPRDLKDEDYASLLIIMGRLGGKKVLKEVLAELGTDQSVVREAAHEALFNWPDDDAAPALVKIAEDAKATPKGRTAIRSLARVCAIPGGSVPVETKLVMLKTAMTCADRDDERKVVLDHIGFVRHIDTLRYVVPYLDSKTLSQSACRAVVELAHSKMLREPNRAEFHKALDRVIAISKDKQLVERARDYKQQ